MSILLAVMFLGMSFCLPLAYYTEYRDKRNSGSADEQLLQRDGVAEKKTNVWMLSIPTIFDLIATVLMNVGLLSVTASVYQMLRGAEMLFAAMFAVFFLKRKLNRYHHAGIACCIFGIALVGSATVLSSSSHSNAKQVNPGEVLMGMGLIILSQAVQAAQITFEDFFMADLAIPPLKIVGYEGVFGSAMMLFLLLPIVQYLPGKDGQGIHEDSIDTWHMVLNTPIIAKILFMDMFALLAYNVSGMCVTGHLGAVFRTVLETTRTLFVWLVDLVLFYTPLGMGKLGESWTSGSWIQAVGFAVLVAGTIIYGKGDEAEIDEGVAEGAYQPIPEEGEAGATVTEGISITPAISMTRPMTVAQSSSFKSSMNINALSASLPSSLRYRALSPPAPPRNQGA